MNRSETNDVYVWDLFVRLFHWSLVAAFFIAYFVEGEDETLAIHVWVGYAVGGLVLMRVVWGFVGPEHARFRDFLFGPFTALRYLFDLPKGASTRYLGHSPAGAWMVFMLLIGLTATVVSGLAVYGLEEKAGPLAPLFASVESAQPRTLAIKPALASEQEGKESDENQAQSGNREFLEEALEEAHDILANLTLLLVILHIGGVAMASFAHKENLVRAMITGRKRSG